MLMRNVETLLRSGKAGKPTAREAESLSRETMSQEAKASGRKATGNRLDRAKSLRRKAADLGQG